MPVKYICSRCGYVLWSFEKVGQDYYGVPTPEEVIRVYGGICPRCKKDLVFNGIENIDIRPIKPFIEDLVMETSEESILTTTRTFNQPVGQEA